MARQVKKSIAKSLNQIRAESSSFYQANVPEVTADTSIQQFSAPLLDFPKIMNEFCDALIQRIVYTQVESKVFNNPLKFLEGDKMPMGYLGQEIFLNPAEQHDYDIDDFSGVLKKYETDVKVQYNKINWDKQYKATIVREKLKQAFVSWTEFEGFITGISNTLYNGAYIDEYNNTKALVANAYRSNAVQTLVLQNPTGSQELTEKFTIEARKKFLDFQAPTSEFNAWKKVGGYGREVITFSKPEDIVFIIRNDINAYQSVKSLAKAFNIDEARLLGNVISVKDFNIYDSKRNVVYDGSHIYGIMCDKSWFRIKEQDMYIDDFRNANNRSMTYFLNVIKMYQYSLFANAIVFCDEEPKVQVQGLDYNNTTSITLEVGAEEVMEINVTPMNANFPKIQYTSSDEKIAIVDKTTGTDRHCKVTAVAQGTATITATSGNISTSFEVTVTANS